MFARSRRLRHRRGEAGFSLIESLVAIAVTTVAIVVLVGAIAAVERDAGHETSQANMELALRTVTDQLRSDSIKYEPCNTWKYQRELSMPSGYSLTNLQVIGPNRTTLLPVSHCGDVGVQKITVGLKLTSGSLQGSRIVWKSQE